MSKPGQSGGDVGEELLLDLLRDPEPESGAARPRRGGAPRASRLSRARSSPSRSSSAWRRISCRLACSSTNTRTFERRISGHDRLEQEVDRADRIALEDLHVGRSCAVRKMIGIVPRALAPADQVGGLEPVHARHLDVHQDDGEVVVEHPPQRLEPRAGAGRGSAPSRAERRLQDEEVVGRVVDQEDVDLGLGPSRARPPVAGAGGHAGHGAARRSRRAGRGGCEPSCSPCTGLAM